MTFKIEVPLITATGRDLETKAIKALTENGVPKEKILYICNKVIVEQEAQTLGVPTVSPRDISTGAKKVSDFDAVFVGDMFPSERAGVMEMLAEFDGLVLNSVLETGVVDREAREKQIRAQIEEKLSGSKSEQESSSNNLKL